METQTYKEVYKGLLQAQDLQPLTRFKSPRSAVMLYPDAQSYPDFFNQNLLSSGRVIKVARGNSALTRAFNYQLMKLTFEIEINEVDYIEVLKSLIFHPGLLQESDEMQSPISGRGCTDRQYKRIIADFIELMGTQTIPNFQFTLMEYPIADEALTYAMEGIISRCYSADGQQSTYSLLSWLSQTFAMNVQKHGKCYRFEESDIFLYQENSTEYYIAFLNEMAEVSDYSQSTHDRKSINDRLGINDRLSSHQQDRKGSHPDLSGPDEEDVDFKLVTDKYRNSAQPQGWKSKRTESPIIRKTINSQVMKEIVVREIDESIEKDKPSQHSKQEDTSKIGSLLDIMSERSSKEHQKSPQVSSSRHFQEDETNKPLTTRTDEDRNYPKIVISQELKSVQEEKQLYNSHDSELILTPQFPAVPPEQEQSEHFNPFTKKYSEKYMHLYEKGVPDYKSPDSGNEYEFGLGKYSGKNPSFEEFKKSFNFDNKEETRSPGTFAEYSSQNNDYSSYKSQFTPKPSYAYESSFTYDNHFTANKMTEDYKEIQGSSYKPSYQYKFDDYSPNEYLPNAAFNSHKTENSSYLKDSLEQLNLNKGFNFNPKNKDEKQESERLSSASGKTFEGKQDSLSHYKIPYEEFSLARQEPSKMFDNKLPLSGEDEEVFFRPEGKSHLKGSKASRLDSELSRGVEDSKGTIYRQFTDTKVLGVMTSLERVKTDAIRQRYRGMHRKDFFKKR